MKFSLIVASLVAILGVVVAGGGLPDKRPNMRGLVSQEERSLSTCALQIASLPLSLWPNVASTIGDGTGAVGDYTGWSGPISLHTGGRNAEMGTKRGESYYAYFCPLRVFCAAGYLNRDDAAATVVSDDDSWFQFGSGGDEKLKFSSPNFLAGEYLKDSAGKFIGWEACWSDIDAPSAGSIAQFHFNAAQGGTTDTISTGKKAKGAVFLCIDFECGDNEQCSDSNDCANLDTDCLTYKCSDDATSCVEDLKSEDQTTCENDAGCCSNGVCIIGECDDTTVS
ncbi:MAG: hypothetical protein SGARI_000152 [Bacillariaceae sp.]